MTTLGSHVHREWRDLLLADFKAARAAPAGQVGYEAIVAYADAWAAQLDRQDSLITELVGALEEARGALRSMADLDSWIAQQCGLQDDEEGDEWFLPVVRTALSHAREEGK